MRRMIHRSRTLRILPFAALALLVAGCGKLDNKKIEDNIKSTLKGKGITMKSIDCPTDRKLKSGDKFTCTGESDDGTKCTFDVEQTDGSGDIKWNLRGSILQADDLGDSIEKKMGENVDVQCPDTTIILPKGKTIDCDVVVDGKKEKVAIKALDNDGTVDWKVGPGGGGGGDDKAEKKKSKKKGDDDDDDDDK